MGKALFIGICGALFGAIGLSVGHLLEDSGLRLLLETCAGAAAGILFGGATIFVLRLWRTSRQG